MRNPYREVLRSYWDSPGAGMAIAVWIIFLFIVFIMFIALTVAAPPKGGPRLAMLAVFYPCFSAMMSFLLILHLKEMLGSPRSRLMPGLHRAHLLVGGPQKGTGTAKRGTAKRGPQKGGDRKKGQAHILTVSTECYGFVRMPRTARVIPGGMVYRLLKANICACPLSPSPLSPSQFPR